MVGQQVPRFNRQHPDSAPPPAGLESPIAPRKGRSVNAKRYALAVILTVAIILPLDVLINAVVMRDAFEQAAPYWLPLTN